jgi:hypothetical protein
MTHCTRLRTVWRWAPLLLLLVSWLAPSGAAAKGHLDGLEEDLIKAENAGPGAVGPVRNKISTEALPDIFGPGAVLSVGNINMKVTNYGFVGNPFTNLSSDPSGQWPGASAIEYLNFLGLSVGAVNPQATTPDAIRRVSYATEWRPATLDPEDKMYRAYDGIVNGTRFVNDDNSPPDPITGFPAIDEDFLDGRDNDGDGRIDEDFAALGQQMYTCDIWDNTVQAVNTTRNEKHVPIGLECRQSAWAYSIAGFQDFNVIQFDVYNRSGHMLDSMTVGFLMDMDAGPVQVSNYYADDLDLPFYPQGEFTIPVDSQSGHLPDAKRRQFPHSPSLDGSVGRGPLCPAVKMRINGFSTADDNGDDHKTIGIPSFLLFDHTVDPTGLKGPARVGFRAFRSYAGSTPYQQGGGPRIDQQRFEFQVGTENIETRVGEPFCCGFISAKQGDTKGDYAQVVSTGPWLRVPDGGMISVTIGVGIKEGTIQKAARYPNDYAHYMSTTGVERERAQADLIANYPSLANALAAQIAFEGIHEFREGYPKTDFHGRETPMRTQPGEPPMFLADCRDQDLGRTRPVNQYQYTWFDFDCDYCTGVWDFTRPHDSDQTLSGMFHKTWNAAAPPPSPNINVASTYNFADNPDRSITPAGDHAVALAWDNLSEVTPDPKSQWFDFRGYRVWKVADWTRPVGSAGPSETDWKLLGEFRLFDYLEHGGVIQHNYTVDSLGQKHCPLVYIPNYNYVDSLGQPRVGGYKPICLDRGDFWDRQSGEIIKPDTAFHCLPDPRRPGECLTVDGCVLHQDCAVASNIIKRAVYPVGRYHIVDREVKNGFNYFYSVTAFDSTFELGTTSELGGRRAAVEADEVTPQVGVSVNKSKVWVVPNPYRGYARISARPSAWDLTPNASDPTGTYIDFMGLPAGQWTIRIYTVSGDLVQELHSQDPVNESIRSPVKIGTDPNGQPIMAPGYNRQQDNPNDGQARWNLISRNGQDIVSGIYIFTVESNQGADRGRFVVIR